VNNLICSEGSIEGTIGEEKRGDRGFGYDPIFLPKGSLLHMAEMDQTKKNLISHRANAFKSLLEKLSSDLTEK
jgi:XTP/dITP diphosphohydrolase